MNSGRPWKKTCKLNHHFDHFVSMKRIFFSDIISLFAFFHVFLCIIFLHATCSTTFDPATIAPFEGGINNNGLCKAEIYHQCQLWVRY